jgi:TonB family protein
MASLFAQIGFALCLAAAPALFARAANTTPVAATQNADTMPSDPSAILSMAAKLNGLNGPNLQPWHIKASYQAFDLKGKPQDSGTYEEFWISDRKYRRSYTSKGFTQTDVATGTGLFRSGNQNWPEYLEEGVRRELTQPIPELNLRNFDLIKKKRSVGPVKLICITLTSEKMFADPALYCFAQDQPALRIDSSVEGMFQTVFDSIVLFQGHFVAKDIRIEYERKPRLVVHVETIEAISAVDDSDFVPPSDATEIPRDKITLSQATVQAFRVLSVPPIYPAVARADHIQGTVVVQTTIGRDGTVIAAQAVSGPSALQQPSVDSVRGWKFRPFLILGKPVEVETQLQIIFTLR